MIRRLLFVLPLLLSGCNAISDGADYLGSYMPTVGEPCHHWQCFTSEGQRKSQENDTLDKVSSQPPVPKKLPPATVPYNTTTTTNPTNK